MTRLPLARARARSRDVAGPAVVALTLSAVLAGCATDQTAGGGDLENPGTDSSGRPAGTAAPADAPRLEVETVVDGLSNPWDLDFLPDGSMLYTQREPKTVTLRTPDGTERTVLDDPDGIWASGETGLMGIAVADDFATSRAFFTCHGYQTDAVQDVRVVRWTLNADQTQSTMERTLVEGLPSSTGRHGGCALLVDGQGTLYVGTGDAAQGMNPQDLTSGGGKVLAVDPETGDGLASNPFAEADDPMQQRVLTYGHRNVQGLARRDDGTIWSVEHGPDVDDEVNLQVPGGDYGWNPVPADGGEDYDESVPMTDQDLPGDQVAAAWSSGDPTIATSGAVFLPDSGWGTAGGALVVTALKASQVRLLEFDDTGELVSSQIPTALEGTHGRLRGAALGPDGVLYLTTSNGSDDEILRVTPAG